jgi:hypothetical protein
MAALTTTDAFFVAYQETSGILMHFGVEVELAGKVERAAVEAALARVLARWPVLGQTLARGLGGLRWGGEVRDVLRTDGEAEAFRNTPIDPFRQPPFGVLWKSRGDTHAFAIRCHHAAADGELFLAIVWEFLGGLAPLPPTPANAHDRHPLAFGALWKQAKLGPSLRHARWLTREARADRTARVALREVAPGPIATSDHRLGERERRALFARASAEKVRPAWLVAAAWLQALHEHNVRRGHDASLLSLEVPVSLRGNGRAGGSGNHLAVLTLFADARMPLGELARSLWRDYAAGVRRRDHLAVPLLANPARLLPWPMFRKVAVTPSSTGFATSHFTWLARDPDVREVVRDHGLRIVDQRLYTPVCLRMGAALCVLAWPEQVQLAITHRLTGLSGDDANALGERLAAKLQRDAGP